MLMYKQGTLDSINQALKTTARDTLTLDEVRETKPFPRAIPPIIGRAEGKPLSMVDFPFNPLNFNEIIY